MKKAGCLLFFFFLFWSSLSLFSQPVTKVYTNQLSGMKITNKLTGKVIEDKELTNFINSHPHVQFEKVIDKYGNIEAYEVDPTKTDGYTTRDETKRVANGEPFPPFVMTSITEKTFDSERLKGRPILIQFHVSLNKPLFIGNFFNELDSIVTHFRKAKTIEAIVVTADLKEEINSSFNTNISSFSIVPDGRNFLERYLITNFPCVVLIDKEGNLVSYYGFGDSAKLKADLMALD